MKVLIIGGTGVISKAVTEKLLEQNREITLFNRGTKSIPFLKDVEQLTGDRNNQDEFRALFKNRSFDAVIDMLSFNEEDARLLVDVFRGRTGQLVVCSSVAAYKRPYRSFPVREDVEELADTPVFPYAFHKAEMERYLQRVTREGLPVTIIRPSLTYGTGSANIGVLRQNYGIIERIKKGKPLVMFGDGTTPWNFTFAPDVAKGFAGVLGNRNTYGKAYHITSEEPHIWEDLYLEIGRLIGREPKIIHIPSDMLMKAIPDLCSHLYFEKSHAGIFDNTRIKQDVPGFQADISLHDGLKSILAWFEQEAHTVDPAKDELEDRLADMHRGFEEQLLSLGRT